MKVLQKKEIVVVVYLYLFIIFFQLCSFGEFEKIKNFAQIATQVLEKGYDVRHEMTMAIPPPTVAITELSIGFMHVMKTRFYHHKDWKECIPNAEFLIL
ncbi:hypothetical protein NHP164001_06110 [Helicobacter trogontum]|uniref:Uncharacterized protein n=1 Tax=Helicobacter trogontum TaxID=50960 RepID=A0ABQ0D2P3_9HELI